MNALTDYLQTAHALLREQFPEAPFSAWLARQWPQAERAFASHGRQGEWDAALAQLPALAEVRVDYADNVRFGTAQTLAADTVLSLREALMALRPWRKGPFEVFGVAIDAEWRSDWKWQRVTAHATSVQGRRVLDVGCGNAYYAWRMLGAGARAVVGLDPGLLQIAQFRALLNYQAHAPIVVLPLSTTALDVCLEAFDSAFSMGVLYHRREPLEHLLQLRRALRAGGELILETLIVLDHDDGILIPAGRYAGMRNVWSLPSTATVGQWLRAAGFSNARCVDVSPTTTAEQRATAWMTSYSLANFLDAEDATRTIEGYPAPQRAIFLADAL